MFGAIIGDIIGSTYEWGAKTIDDSSSLITESSHISDDSVMTIAVSDIIYHKKWNNPSSVKNTLKKYVRLNPYIGYGPEFLKWAMSKSTKPYGSYGNGSAMRISACGWYGESEKEVIEMAKAVTIVSHNHPDAVAGAIVTALCIYFAKIGKDKEYIKTFASGYYKCLLDDNYFSNLESTFYKEKAIAIKTVPVAIECFLRGKDFIDTIKLAVSLGGDSDTIAAIAGSIAEAYYKEIDNELLDKALYIVRNELDLDIEYLIEDHIKQINKNKKP